MSIESRLRSVYKTGILLSRGSTQPYLWSTSSSPLLISMGLFFPPFVAAMITVDTKLSHDVCVFSNGRMWLHSVSAVCVRVRFSFQFPRFPCAPGPRQRDQLPRQYKVSKWFSLLFQVKMNALKCRTLGVISSCHRPRFEA